MKYKKKSMTTGSPSLIVPPLTGAIVGTLASPGTFLPWQPSTWPPPPAVVDADFVATLGKIFNESILDEIRNVAEDAKKANGDLQHRGHVLAIALMCALDAISSYGYRGKRGKHIAKFVRAHFPAKYGPYANDIYKLYRNSLIHSWNLFQASILPGAEEIVKNGALCFGLLNFLDALRSAMEGFLAKLPSDPDLQKNTVKRYSKLKRSAKP